MAAASLGSFVSTSYGPPWNAMNGSGVTANGTDLRPARKAYGVAVDPTVIRLGTKLNIWPNPFGYTGTFIAFDTGGAIKGRRLDFYDWRGRSTQMGWGRKTVNVKVASTGSGGGGLMGSIFGNPLQPGNLPGPFDDLAKGAFNAISPFDLPNMPSPQDALSDVTGVDLNPVDNAVGAVTGFVGGVIKDIFLGRVGKVILGTLILLLSLSFIGQVAVKNTPAGKVAMAVSTAKGK